MNGFDWAGLLRAGMARGLAPREVWRLTPAELAFLLGKAGGPPGLTRARLEELAAAYPDNLSEGGNGGR